MINHFSSRYKSTVICKCSVEKNNACKMSEKHHTRKNYTYNIHCWRVAVGIIRQMANRTSYFTYFFKLCVKISFDNIRCWRETQREQCTIFTVIYK